MSTGARDSVRSGEIADFLRRTDLHDGWWRPHWFWKSCLGAVDELAHGGASLPVCHFRPASVCMKERPLAAPNDVIFLPYPRSVETTADAPDCDIDLATQILIGS